MMKFIFIMIIAITSLFAYSENNSPGRLAMSDTIIHNAQNQDPEPGLIGEKPYEMEGRKEERIPLVDFRDVSDWIVEGKDAEGWLYLSQEQKLYHDYCAKLVYIGKGENPSILVKPEKPIPITDPWDNVNFWNYGNGWGWAPNPEKPFLHVAIVLMDADDKEFEIPMGTMDYQYWFLMNSRLHNEIKRPAKFVGFRFTNGKNKDKQAVYLGPCYFFKEVLKPLTFEPFPDKLPFPTRKETILPTNKIEDFENSVSQEGKATIFAYNGADCEMKYRYTPNDGTLNDIELIWDGKTIKPCAKGGMWLATPKGNIPADDTIKRTLKDISLSEGTLKALWHFQCDGVQTDVEYRIYIKQKSLVVEMDASEPVIERIALGRAEGISNGRLFKIPYLTYGGNDPKVLCADGLFFFTQFDWYVSDASVLYGGSELGDNWAIYNGGAQYIPKTDGKRNPVHERLFINVSPDFQEVLPTIANPKSPMKEEQGDRLWRVKFGGQNQAEIAEAELFRKYGCEKISIRFHEDTWRDEGESFTFRLNPAPKKGGDEGLKNFVSAIKAVGWRIGLYTNYTDYAPVNSYWNEDWVNRLPNGDWQRSWMRCYAPKPMIAVQMEALLAPQINAKFGENHSYCDVHTAVSPFSRVDYDYRVPGAGTFRRTFECFGRLLYNEKFAHKGPVYSEGNNHWWYVGLTDGNYAQIISPDPPKEPLLVDFDLLKMHPLNMDAGMGAPEMFFRGNAQDIDQFIATTLAYGHIGFMSWSDMAGALKIYYMVQQIQSRYTLIPVKKIEYEREGKMVSTSQALSMGDKADTSRVHVVYENQTEVWVNASDESWIVKGYELPKWGYLAINNEDGLLAYSALVNKHRVDCCYGTDQYYADSHGEYVSFGKIKVDGSAALKKDYGKWWIIPTTQCKDFAFDPSIIGMGRDIEVIGYAEDGSVIGKPEIKWVDGMLHVRTETLPAFKYEIR
jgi:hypothetical protein